MHVSYSQACLIWILLIFLKNPKNTLLVILITCSRWLVYYPNVHCSSLTVTTLLFTSSKKNETMILHCWKLHQRVHFSGCNHICTIIPWFSSPQMLKYCLFTNTSNVKWFFKKTLRHYLIIKLTTLIIIYSFHLWFLF